jgi:hypothetical protein
MRTKLVLSLIALVSFAAESFAQPMTMASTTAVGRRALAGAVAAGTSIPRTYTFGTSCGGTPVGSAQISIDANTTADVGDSVIYRLTGAPALTTVVLNIDEDLPAYQGIPLPFDMSTLNAPGCHAYVGPTLSYGAMTDANGEASITILIPNSPGLNGLRLNAQWLITQSAANPLGVTASNAISTVIRNPIILRSVIGPNNASTNGLDLVAMWNTQPSGSSFYSVPLPVTPTEAVRIKKIRLVGSPLGTGSGGSGPGTADIRIWSSLQNAASAYQVGDVFNGWIGAPATSTVFGISLYNQPTFEKVYNVLTDLSTLTLQGTNTYYIGISLETAGFGSFGVSDTNASSCSPDTLVGTGLNGGLLIAGPTISSGCVAIDIVGTAN